jgi:hypothetical protein
LVDKEDKVSRSSLPLVSHMSPANSVNNTVMSSSAGSDDGSDYSKVADRLNKLMLKPSISAQELRELVYGKWGRTYEVRLCKLRGQMYLQVSTSKGQGWDAKRRQPMFLHNTTTFTPAAVKPYRAAEPAYAQAAWVDGTISGFCHHTSPAWLQVMWKFLEQQSFHLSEDEYMEQLDAVAHFLNEWGVDDV